MKSLKIKNFGPIGNVDVKFGDLTFLVGPQASGKSLFLELLKYVIDKEPWHLCTPWTHTDGRPLRYRHCNGRWSPWTDARN